MKFATIPNGTPDGRLVLVSRDLTVAVCLSDLAPTMLQALGQWDAITGRLESRYALLNEGTLEGTFTFETKNILAPLPRAWQWLDGSAFPSHGERMVKAFGLSDASLRAPSPLMYQGCNEFLGAEFDIQIATEDYGIDFEGEVAAIVGDVSMGSTVDSCARAIRLFLLIDDVSLRALQPLEMSLGFGMIQSKPASICSPVAVTPDELGEAYSNGKVGFSLIASLNGVQVGRLSGTEMRFSFGEIIAHAARTRRLAAGTIVGSGTFSNYDSSRGVACIAEARALEKIGSGKISKEWLRYGDRVRIEMLDARGVTIFGAIDHSYVAGPAAAGELIERVAPSLNDSCESALKSSYQHDSD